MLIGHSMPPVTACNFIGSGAGNAWLTADGYAALFDGKPARAARMRWRNDAAPSIAHAVIVSMTFASAFKPRIVALLGLTCGAGVKVEIRNADATPLGGTSLTSRTVQFADGSVGVWVVLDGTVSTSGLQLHIFNDRNGAPWATSATALDIGEVVAMPAVDVEIQRDWTDELVDPTQSAMTRGAQVVSSRRQAYRRLEVALTAESAARVRAGGLEGGMDWHRLRAALLGDRRMVAIPRWRTPGGAVDGAEINRTALYGVARMGAAGHLGGDFYGTSMAVQEVPAPA